MDAVVGGAGVDASPQESGQGADRYVSVAVDAVGGGGARPFTYGVPASLADLRPGEAVLVEFGRRQALGVILGDAPRPDGIAAKPIAARIRADGPLLPPLALRLAAWIADHYLAPPALVIRAMLPPGLLERLELLAERTAAIPGERPAADRDLLDQLERGPRPIRDLVSVEGRAGLLRRLRVLAADGLVTLDWTVLGAGAGPRYERWVRLTDSGSEAAAALARGAEPGGTPLGLRQRAVLATLSGATEPTSGGLPAAPLGEEHGTATLASLARRGLL